MRRTVAFIVMILAVAAGFGFWWSEKNTVFHLTGVSDVVGVGESVYVVDNDGDTYDFFKLSQAGEVEGHIGVPKLSDEWWNAYTHLSVDEDGSVYVHQYGKSMAEDETRAAVYRCDFDEGTLFPMWTLDGRKAVQCQVIGGNLYTAVPLGQDEGTRFLKIGADNKKNLVYETDFPYSRMVSAYYQPGQGILWSDYNGILYKNDRVLLEAGSNETNSKAHICLEQDRVTYTDTDKGTVEAIDVATEKRSTLFPAEDVKLKGMGLEYKDILPFHYGEKFWYGALDLEGNNRVASVFDYGGAPVLLMSKVAYPAVERWRQGVRASLLVLFFQLLMWSLAYAYFQVSGGIFSIVMKLFLSTVPMIMAGGIWLAGRTVGTLTDYSMKSGYDMLYALADSRLSRIRPQDLQKIVLSKVPKDPMYQNIFGGEDYSQLPMHLYGMDDRGGEPVTATTYQWVYMEEADTLKYLVVDDSYYGGKVEYYRDREQMKLMERAMEEKVVVRSRYNDQEGNWLALYVPIIDEKGESIGVMESGMSTGNLQYASRRQTAGISARILIFFVLLIGVLTVILKLCLRPLARLQRAVDEMAGGNYAVSVRASGNDEVGSIARAFNRMSSQLKSQMEYIGACFRGYEKFVPGRVFAILGREDITRLELGDHKQITASLLAADSASFSQLVRNMDGEEIYASFNAILKNVLPTVAEHDGIVDHMLEAGVLAYFPGEAELALKAAVSIRQQFSHGADRPMPSMGIGIARGPVRIGIVGQEGRAAVKTMSESVTLACYLSQIAQKYGAGILITGTAAREIKDFTKRYHVRCIGYLKLELSGSAEILYEVYDGEEPQRYQKKKAGSRQFQAGMEAFLRQDYYGARQQFAKVLMADKDDLAARAYVYRCDVYYQMEDKSQAELYLEHY